ncbi:hypothetical protein ABZ352_18715 [Streptomyces griseofuscus]|uniref:hypothetical protein n=1 Tax=Streptomyces griseofuscus TaxID=146922 RepID=UPI0033F77D45
MKVTIRFPHGDRSAELPGVPRQGETLYWREGRFNVTEVAWDADPQQDSEVTITVDPADMKARHVIEADSVVASEDSRAQPAAEKPGLSEEEAAALVEGDPALALLGAAWVRNLSRFGFRTFQMRNLVRQLRPELAEAPPADSGDR